MFTILITCIKCLITSEMLIAFNAIESNVLVEGWVGRLHRDRRDLETTAERL